MNHTSTYFQQAILNGIKDLSLSDLQEIANYVFFIRKKALHPDIFKKEFNEDLLINEEMRLMDNEQLLHLEEEFLNYKTNYPKENE